MIGAIIVDDDVEILQGLRGFVPWEAHGFRIVGTAADGRRALELVRAHRPRLLIADITMPAMDGLSLIRESLRICPELKSIVLTCHEDFAFAQEAISLGVMDYLLKITLTPAMLTRSLLRVREAVGREPVRPAPQADPPLGESDFLRALIDADDKDAEALIQEFARTETALPGRAFRAFTFFLDNFRRDSFGSNEPARRGGAGRVTPASVVQVIREACGDRRDTSVVALGDAAFVLILWYPGEPLTIPADLHAAIQLALRRIGERYGQEASCCVSGPFLDLKKLAQSVEECRGLRESYFYAGSGSVVTRQTAWRADPEGIPYESFSRELGRVLASEDAGPHAGFMARLTELGRGAVHPPALVRGLLARLLVDIDTAANKRGFVLDHAHSAADTFPACLAVFQSALAAYREKAGAALPASSRDEIRGALRYMHEHPGEPVRCESMAARVNLSPAYFSRLFKKEVGMSFTDYLLRQRIGQARELLATTRMSVEEVTWSVGLENASYFHRAFKKLTGLTPRQARGKS
jgi:two-component system, response regulator YesN